MIFFNSFFFLSRMLNWSKVRVYTFVMGQKKSKGKSFLLFINESYGFHKNIKPQDCFHRWKEMFLKHQISILEWFLKDHLTMKTEVMAAENIFKI